MVKYDEWNQVNVKISKISVDKMKILIYVNKFLVFVSKELPLFNFRALDEVSQKQEAVPYNISLGGGSLGLLETIIPNYYAVSEYILPIEQHFCGSFLGDIKSFKILLFTNTVTDIINAKIDGKLSRLVFNPSFTPFRTSS